MSFRQITDLKLTFTETIYLTISSFYDVDKMFANRVLVKFNVPITV